MTIRSRAAGFLDTRSLTLVPKTAEEVRQWVATLDPATRKEVSPAWLELVAATDGPDPWTLGFTMVQRNTGEAVGHCGFKGPPIEAAVEIAYGVDPEFQGRGYATEAADALTRYALEHPDVTLVRAHTMAEDNASTHVLRRCGFECLGTVVDPEDGVVWRWERRRPPL